MHKAKQFRAKLSSRRGMLCFCDSDRSREKLFSGKEEEEEICENMLVWGKTTSRHAKVYDPKHFSFLLRRFAQPENEC